MSRAIGGPAILAGLIGSSALFFVLSLRAEEPAGNPSANDCRLTLKARQALAEDKGLAGQNVGVSVRNSEATLWGAVPSRQLCRRAETLVQQVAGIVRVINALRVIPAEAPAREPPPIDPVLKNLLENPPQEPLRTPGNLTKNDAKPGKPTGTEMVRHAEPAVRLEGPVLLQSPATVKDNRSDLSESIKRLRAGNTRFRTIQTELADGIVYLRGPTSADLFTLAQEISRLPGVVRVVVAAGR